MKKRKSDKDSSTEQKIIEAARKVFTQKGYTGARTRDIAQEAGINLALLNYYYRSKEKLFGIVIGEKFLEFFGVLSPILSNEKSTLDEKIDLIVEGYITLLLDHPDLPLFVLSEIKNHPDHFAKLVQHTFVIDSIFWKQLQAAKPELNALHFLTNILGITVFPFVSKPVFEQIGAFERITFEEFINERKKLIPMWIKTMLKEN